MRVGKQSPENARARTHTHNGCWEENKELNRGQAFNLSTIRLAMET